MPHSAVIQCYRSFNGATLAEWSQPIRLDFVPTLMTIRALGCGEVAANPAPLFLWSSLTSGVIGAVGGIYNTCPGTRISLSQPLQNEVTFRLLGMNASSVLVPTSTFEGVVYFTLEFSA